MERQKAAEINVSGNMWLLNVSSKSNSHPRPMIVRVTSSLFTCQGHGKAAAMQGGSTDYGIWNHTQGFGAESLWLQTPTERIRAANRNHPGWTSPLLPETRLCSQGPGDFCSVFHPSAVLWRTGQAGFAWKGKKACPTGKQLEWAQIKATLRQSSGKHWRRKLQKTPSTLWIRPSRTHFFLLLRLLFAMVLEELSLWVLCLSPGGREWMRSNCSMILHPAGLGYPLAGCSSPVQHVWKQQFFFFQDFWPTHSYSTLVCPFMFSCFVFIFWRIRCLERELGCLTCCIISSHLRRLFCPRRVFFSILFSPDRFLFWELPPRICQSLFAIYAVFPGCKKRIFKLVVIVRIDKLLSGNCWTRKSCWEGRLSLQAKIFPLRTLAAKNM